MLNNQLIKRIINSYTMNIIINVNSEYDSLIEQYFIEIYPDNERRTIRYLIMYNTKTETFYIPNAKHYRLFNPLLNDICDTLNRYYKLSLRKTKLKEID